MNLSFFNANELFESGITFFKSLNIPIATISKSVINLHDYISDDVLESEYMKLITNSYYLGAIDESVFKNDLFYNGPTSDDFRSNDAIEVDRILLFIISLKDNPKRKHLADITRTFNKMGSFPIVVLFSYAKEGESHLSLAISEMFKYKKKSDKAKVGKIILLDAIKIEGTHAGHRKILDDLRLPITVKSYAGLHEHWLKVFDVKELNKKFYKEISNWFFWARDLAIFPNDHNENEESYKSISIIRLLTRLIFVWFLKEKKLVPDKLFDFVQLKNLIKDLNLNNSGNYYNAILQNLFFATLNQEQNERKFATNEGYQQNKAEYGIKNLYRYSDRFLISESEALDLFRSIPFLNGGLFDCLDKESSIFNKQTDNIESPSAIEEDKSRVYYVDGFSRNTKKTAHLSDKLFFTENQQVDITKYFEKSKNKVVEVKGLINILSSYKFTVLENTPEEEEVALDPELLGRVFENLLASYNPETSTTARKETGSFYTPSEIVDFMTEETLFEYLKSKKCFLDDESGDKLRRLFEQDVIDTEITENEKLNVVLAIDSCKVLDPACGSGAFPMGMLQKMVSLLRKVDPDNNFWKNLQLYKACGKQIDAIEADKNTIQLLSDEALRSRSLAVADERIAEIIRVFETDNYFDNYARKLFIIENCIYGVDLQPIAIQITKLRFFISLIIDQKSVPDAENFGYRSLPNLETKLVGADALTPLSVEINQGFIDNKVSELQQELSSLRLKYINVNSRKEKITLQKKDKKLLIELKENLDRSGFSHESAAKIADFNPYDLNNSSTWFDKEWMFGLSDKSFDIVIGNPPYIQLQKESGRLAKKYEKNQFETFNRMGDIYSLFYEQGLKLLNPNGILCYITSNKWMRAGYGEETRKFFSTKTDPIALIDLGGQKIFESATVDTNILLFSKAKNSLNTKTCILDAKPEEKMSVYFRQNNTIQSFNTSDSWVILSDIERSIKAKIEAVGTPLKDWDINISRGILTGYNEAFIIDGETKAKLIAEDPKSAEIIRPILRGRDIKRYSYEFDDLWLINTHNGIKDKDILPINVNSYPAIKRHLDNFLPELTKRLDKGDTPYNLRNCAYMEDFYEQKIMYPNMTQVASFYYDKLGFFSNDKSFFITGNNLAYLVSFLNSTIFRYCFFASFPKLGKKGYELRKIFFEKILVPKVSVAENLVFRQLVEEIQIGLKKSQDTSSLQNEIDKKIFQIYNLTQEEIKIIRSSNPAT